MGDGVLGLFGALDAPTDEGVADAEHAVCAAEQLRAVYADLQATWERRWAMYTPQVIDVGLGCGIHTGEVLVGNVGSGARDQFTVLGPPVNFAKRLEAHAAKGEILISQQTEARVRGRIETLDAGILEGVKNIPGSFRMFSVLPPA
jgi:class 3 adenylate cyclase